MRHVKYHGPDTSYPLSKRVADFLQTASKAADTIAALVPNQNIVLIGLGTSGAMTMTAVAQRLLALGRKPYCCLLSKEDERSHRCSHEHDMNTKLKSPIAFVVDDCISTGYTLERIFRQLDTVNYCDERWNEQPLADITKGVVLMEPYDLGGDRLKQEALLSGVELEYFITRVDHPAAATPFTSTNEKREKSSTSCKETALCAEEE